jgi:hypothetical protein
LRLGLDIREMHLQEMMCLLQEITRQVDPALKVIRHQRTREKRSPLLLYCLVFKTFSLFM